MHEEKEVRKLLKTDMNRELRQVKGKERRCTEKPVQTHHKFFRGFNLELQVPP